MNSSMRVQSHEIPVGPDNEATFHEQFWKNVDVAVNALDNIKVRIECSHCAIYVVGEDATIHRSIPIIT